jgi:membrane fusion protein, multidrug efflux system
MKASISFPAGNYWFHFRIAKWLFGSGLLPIVLFCSSCNQKGDASVQPKSPGGAPVPVTQGVVTQENVPVELQAIGNVDAYSVVSIKSQVNGPLQTVHFKEGQDVRQGDLLFSIDPRPFEAALRQVESQLGRDQASLQQAQANLEKNLAQMRLAETNTKRYQDLNNQGIVPRQTAEQYQTDQQALEASVQADRAAIDNAKAAIRADQANIDNARLQLSYCSIYSPITGRTGNLQVYPGNLVKANDVPILVVINQISPVYVSFSVPEKYLGNIKEELARGKLPVRAVSSGTEKQTAEGFLSFVDNKIDETTGTIQLKATFPNTDRRLWPGQFANVSLQLTTLTQAVVVPTQAVQTGQQGTYVYIVKSDKTAEIRNITIQQTAGTKTVVSKGVQPGETVVLDGQLRLAPGTRVESKNLTPEKSTQEKTS